MPWYIGKAEKQTFKQECFTHHKLIKFVKDFLLEYGLRLEARKQSDFKMLNKDRHDVTTKMLRNLEVEGFVNSRKYSSGNIKDLKKLLGISE